METWNKQTVKNYTLRTCKERFLLNQRVFYFSKDFYLVEEINYQISVLSANGILENIIKEYYDYTFLNVRQDDVSVTPLGIKQLSGILFVSIGCLMACLSVFIVEIIWNKFKQRKF